MYELYRKWSPHGSLLAVLVFGWETEKKTSLMREVVLAMYDGRFVCFLVGHMAYHLIGGGPPTSC